MKDTKNIYEHLAGMRAFIGRGEWSALEGAYATTCAGLAGPHQAERIAQLDFKSYERLLEKALREAVALRAAADAQALYFEYDLDNSWESNFFFCEQYAHESAEDEDWACQWTAHYAGPSFEDASRIYGENHFDRTAEAKGSTLYLVARTVAAFGRCSEKVPIRPVAVCIGFHDQDPIFRVHEAAG